MPSLNDFKVFPEGGIARADYTQARPMSGLTHEQMLHESPVSMLNKNPSEAKTSKPPKRPRGAAPDMVMMTD